MILFHLWQVILASHLWQWYKVSFKNLLSKRTSRFKGEISIYDDRQTLQKSWSWQAKDWSSGNAITELSFRREWAASLRSHRPACPWLTSRGSGHTMSELQSQNSTPGPWGNEILCRKVKGTGLAWSVAEQFHQIPGHDGGHYLSLWRWTAKANRLNVKISCEKDPIESSKPWAPLALKLQSPHLWRILGESTGTLTDISGSKCL